MEQSKNQEIEILSPNITILSPDISLKEKSSQLEKKLLSLLNINDLYYTDIPLKSNPKIYHHTLQSKYDPSKPTFILIHGYLGSSTNYIPLSKYLIPKYNLFIPDTIGCALSSRPQIKFTSSEQCVNFYIDTLHEFIKSLNLKNKFFICGHSLGGYFVSSYSLKYPQNIEKVLLLSPAGISDIKNYDGDIHENCSFFRSFGLKISKIFFPFETTVQEVYHNFLLKPFFKLGFKKRFDVSDQLNEIFSELTQIYMDYPSDLDKSLFYIFTYPFPLTVLPNEKKMLEDSKLKYIICFGENDWMDQCGSRRLESKCKDRFKVYIVSKKGHKFATENPEEVANIIFNNF